MIRIGPITIMSTKTARAYSDVTKAAWPIHGEIWFFGENTSWPEGLKKLPAFDAVLVEALSRTPFEDAP